MGKESSHGPSDANPLGPEDFDTAAEGLFARSRGVKVALDVLAKARGMDDTLRQQGGPHPSTRRYALRVENGNRTYTPLYPFAHDSVLMRAKRESAPIWGTGQAIMLRFGLSQRHPSEGLQPNGQVVITYERKDEPEETFLLNDLGYEKISNPVQYVILHGAYEELQGSELAAGRDDFNAEEFEAILEDFEPTPHLPPSFYKAS